MQEKLPDLRRFKKIEHKALLSTQERVNIIGTGKGVILGKAKEPVRKAEFNRKIHTKKDAYDLIRKEFRHNLT